MLYSNLSVNENGHLTFAGVDTVEMAKKYGTPLFLVDEQRIRDNCRMYVNAMREHFGNGSFPLYASKAFSFKEIYRIANDENMGVDFVSIGEMYTALKAGFPIEKGFFHGNNKTLEDIEFAVKNGVGYIVADNPDELYDIDAECKKQGKKQKILLRITPGVDSHTFEKINTGKVDSKFGMPIVTGQAEQFCIAMKQYENIEFCGYHCHIGSQIFDCDPFYLTADIMVDFIADMNKKHGIECKILNLGSGFGIKYNQNDIVMDRVAGIKGISQHIKDRCNQKNIPELQIIMEPGRGIVGDACITLYTVGSVKEIPGYRNYVSIDGGMTDNPRYALYGAEHEIINAQRASEIEDYVCTVAGRCCESGDLIRENVKIAKAQKGDIIAALTTGAYNYSMASNYNRICRPAVVMINDKKDRVVIRRETLDDLIQRDV